MLRQFATRYAKEFGVDKYKMTVKLWGDDYKCWLTTSP